jgi:hypothetical protein
MWGVTEGVVGILDMEEMVGQVAVQIVAEVAEEEVTVAQAVMEGRIVAIVAKSVVMEELEEARGMEE